MSTEATAVSEFLEQVCCASGEHPVARFWRSYWFDAGHIHRLARMIGRMEPLLESKPALLDVGGFGELLLLLWRFHGLGSLRGVSLEGNRIGYKDGRLVSGDDPASEFTIVIDECDVERERLKFEDSSFDLVTCLETLEHLRYDPVFMILEIHRVLRPGGGLILTTPNSSSWASLARVSEFDNPFMFSTYFSDGSGIGHCKEFSVNELRLFLENAGFSIEQYETFDPLPRRSRGSSEQREELRRYLEGRNWWLPAMRNESHFVLARKTSSPQMRMYQPLYTEDFTCARTDKPTGLPDTAPAESDDALRQQHDQTRLLKYIAQLREEIESRTRWALSLQQSDKEHRDALAALRGEFDARGRWALSLDQEVHRQGERILQLQQELSRQTQQLDRPGFLLGRMLKATMRKITGRT